MKVEIILLESSTPFIQYNKRVKQLINTSDTVHDDIIHECTAKSASVSAGSRLFCRTVFFHRSFLFLDRFVITTVSACGEPFSDWDGGFVQDSAKV